MATYQVFVNKGTLGNKEKESVAQAITDVHCEMTSTPKYCIQVIIHEVADENRFICGRRYQTNMWINAEVRPHSAEMAHEYMDKLTGEVSKVCNFYQENIWVDLNETLPTLYWRFGLTSMTMSMSPGSSGSGNSNLTFDSSISTSR